MHYLAIIYILFWHMKKVGSVSIMMLEIVANPELQDVQSISNHNVRFSLYWS